MKKISLLFLILTFVLTGCAESSTPSDVKDVVMGHTLSPEMERLLANQTSFTKKEIVDYIRYAEKATKVGKSTSRPKYEDRLSGRDRVLSAYESERMEEVSLPYLDDMFQEAGRALRNNRDFDSAFRVLSSHYVWTDPDGPELRGKVLVAVILGYSFEHIKYAVVMKGCYMTPDTLKNYEAYK